MLKGMIFVDHMNFDIALQDYYKNLGQHTKKLDYNKLFVNITKLVDNVDFIKASIFVPKPDHFLMSDPHLNRYYTWVSGLGRAPFTDVIEGRYCARPVSSTVPMNITHKNTYYKVEKGTDINLAVDVINKAFHNSYDIAYIVSADTDYIKVYDILKSYGKLVVVVVVDGQATFNIKSHVDAVFTLDDAFFSTCLRTPAPPTPIASVSASSDTSDTALSISSAPFVPATSATFSEVSSAEIDSSTTSDTLTAETASSATSDASTTETSTV